MIFETLYKPSRTLGLSRPLLAIALFTFVLYELHGQSLTGTFQSKSIFIGSAQGANGLSVAFTTPSTIASLNPQLPFNGEFQSSDDPVLPFLSYWVMFQADTAIDLGILGLGSTAVTLDSDINGIPDFAERHLAATVVADIAAISHVTGGSESGTITLTRNAGQETGIAITQFDSGNDFTGTWTIPIVDVSGSYDSTQRTFRIRTASLIFDPGTMTGSYSRLSDDVVSFNRIVYVFDNGSVITSTPVTFMRSGKTYQAIVEFPDGNILGNTFPDFQRWTLQITDSTDSDADGIPDFSDGTPLGQPPTLSRGPIGLALSVGQTANFNVLANGSAPLHYQWLHNNLPIAEATSSTYTIAAVNVTDAGSYSVAVRNPAGEVISAQAILAVTSPQVSSLLLGYHRETTGEVTLTWTGTAKLTHASALEGPYADVGNASTGYRFAPTGTSAFYRLRP